MAELVDARDLKSLDGNVVWVRVPPPAPAFAREAKRVKAATPKPTGRRRALGRELRLGKPRPRLVMRGADARRPLIYAPDLSHGGPWERAQKLLKFAETFTRKPKILGEAVGTRRVHLK